MDSRHPAITVEKILGETLDIDGKYCVCANGAQYRKDIHGFLPEMMQEIYNERTIYKKRMLESKQALEHATTPAETLALQKDISKFNNIQMARKIQLNSAYGAIGNQYFRYYNLANAEAITLSGQVSIRWIEAKVNSYLNKLLNTEDHDYVIASDTDSIYICLDLLVRHVFDGKDVSSERIVNFLDAACKKRIEPFIDRSYQELADYVGAYEQKMFMKRENIANKGIWTAKKRYILNVWDSEGVRYEKPKLKIMGHGGSEIIYTCCMSHSIRDCLKVIMNKDEEAAQNLLPTLKMNLHHCRSKIYSFPRGCNGINKWSNPATIYSKGTPIHVRGALLYNFYNKKNKLTHKYPLIQDGEKIKFVYLKTPNKINENVISYLATFPKEFGLDKQVDYDLQFWKEFP